MSTQELDICNTPLSKVVVTTTGITKIELELIRSVVPKHVTIQEKLSTSTNYLLTYRCIFTPKYIQATKWNIPIIKVSWIYDMKQNITRVQVFENTLFSTLKISNDIFKNYFIIQGATYHEDIHRATDFVVADDIDEEKKSFCNKYGIPVIGPQDVFKNDFLLFTGNFKMNAYPRSENELFTDKVFLVDARLPVKLFNSLKRLILDNEGTRVSIEESNVDLIISDSVYDYKGKVHFYQFVFDCIESNSFLLPDFYEIRRIQKHSILESCVCYISNELLDNKKVITNKLQAMGARVRPKLDFYCNYFIVKSKKEIKKNIKQKIVTFDWVDQCLYSLRVVKDDKYAPRKPMLNVLKRSKKKAKVIYLSDPKEMLFQFTGLPSHFKIRVIEMCEKYKIKYFDCETYEKCTHLIMGKINTSEKFLSALANGAWILRPDFIDGFDGTKEFNFEKHEWVVDEGTSPSDAKIIGSIVRWRKYVMETGKPAFYKWTVKLHCEEPKKERYKRVLVNGGARITEDSDFNQCFVSQNYKKEAKDGNMRTTDCIFAYLFKKEH